MNLNEFRSKLLKYGGASRPNLFMVEIMNTGSEFVEDQDLRFFCKSITVPGVSFTTNNFKPYSVGPDQLSASGINYEQVSGIFILDSAHAIMSFFHNWSQKIVNFNTNNGMMSSVDGMYPFEIGYKDDYTVTMRICYFGSDDSFYEIILENAWPTSVGQLTLSWDENDSYASLPVSFAYDGMHFSSTVSGSATERFSRSNGVIERIAELASAQTVNQSSFPRTIQAAIDKYSRVRNTFNNIKSWLR